MLGSYLTLPFLLILPHVRASQIDLEIPSLSASHTFELSSNTSQFLDRDVLFGLVDGAPAAIPSAIHVRASYEQMQIERFFNLHEPNTPSPIHKEPIFRSYLLTPTFNRSHPFVRVLIGSAQGPYEKIQMLPMCAVVTAVNEQHLYETQARLISPSTGYCLVTLPVLKMVERMTKNQTLNKIELYLKLHHVAASSDCQVDQTPKQEHIHQEARIGHAEYTHNDNIAVTTISRSSVSVDYPSGVHYPNWYFPLKLKLVLSPSIPSSFLVRCRLPSSFAIHAVQTSTPKIANTRLRFHYNISSRQGQIDLDFNVTIQRNVSTDAKSTVEVSLATISLFINSTSAQDLHPPSPPIEWFLFTNKSSASNEPVFRTPIHVQDDDVQTIVSLTDFTSLINIAMLSSQRQLFALRVLAVNYSGAVQPTSQAVCHSENKHLIEVDSACNNINFSGDERDDFFDHVNSPTSIVVRYDKFLQRLPFTIYIPERPLRIELSDTKLSRINGWFIINRDDDQQKTESSTNGSEDDEDDDDDDEDDDDDDDIKCYPVYQQARIHVYTKFYRTTQNGDRIYLFNKLNVLITPFVRTLLETDNARVAIVRNGRAIGIGPGKTNVRIYSHANKLPMGSKTLYVDDQESIRIQTISFNLLTSIDLRAHLVDHIDPIYKVRFQIKPIFNQFSIDRKNQFGQINIILTYSDNTSIALDEIPADYYQFELDIARTNPPLVRFDTVASWRKLHVYPLAIGQTSLHGRLKLGQQQCTDDRSFSQSDLTCEVNIRADDDPVAGNRAFAPSHHQSDHYVILNNHADSRFKASPFLIALSILLGACIVLFLAFLVHWFIHFYYQRKSADPSRRQRHSSHSGAEEANHDWIFLDRNSLELPAKPSQTNSPSMHNSTLHITSNPLLNSSTLQRQKELTGLSHSQMIAYFESLKESHA